MTGESTSEHKRRVQEQFGAAAQGYVVSPNHAQGEDLEQIRQWTEGGPDRSALDIATGGGHTALVLAAEYGGVVATDLTERMLVTAQSFLESTGADNVEFRVADAERLPFKSGSFDAAACRIAPHHFSDVSAFVSEVARVLKPGGIFLLEDSVVPEDRDLGEFLNRAEELRDPTHIRTLTRSEWRNLLEEHGLTVEAERSFRKTHPFAPWVERSNTSAESRAEVERAFREASEAAREAFSIQLDSDGAVQSYSDEKTLFKARKPSVVE